MWENTINLEDGREYNLNVSSNYFFMYITNNGTHELSPIITNYGTSDELEDDIVVPNDGTKYSIGYYKGNASTIIRAYYVDEPATYIYWDDINFSGEMNQSVTFNTTLKNSKAEFSSKRSNSDEVIDLFSIK